MLHIYIEKNRTYLRLFVLQLHVVYLNELMCGYLTTVVWLLNCCVVIELVYDNHVLPRNCPLCASSVRPLPYASIFCRRTLHLCDRYPFRLLTKSVSAVSGQDFMVVKLLHFFCVFLIFFFCGFDLFFLLLLLFGCLYIVVFAFRLA